MSDDGYRTITENELDELCQDAVETALFPRKRLKGEVPGRYTPAKGKTNDN